MQIAEKTFKPIENGLSGWKSNSPTTIATAPTEMSNWVTMVGATKIATPMIMPMAARPKPQW